MSSRSAQTTLVITIFTLLLLVTLTTADDEAGKAPADCSITDFPDLCNPLLADKTIATRVDLVDAAAKQTMAELKHAVHTVKGAQSQASSDGEKDNLDQCKSYYKQSMGSVEEACQLLKDPNASNVEVRNKLAAAQTMYSSCKDEWASTGLPFTLGDTHDKMNNMFMNLLRIANYSYNYTPK